MLQHGSPTEEAVNNTNVGLSAKDRGAVIILMLSAAVVCHLIIQAFYPPSIDRSQWLAGYALLAARNGLIGLGLGIAVSHPWLGLFTGVVIPPVVVLVLVGIPC